LRHIEVKRAAAVAYISDTRRRDLAAVGDPTTILSGGHIVWHK